MVNVKETREDWCGEGRKCAPWSLCGVGSRLLRLRRTGGGGGGDSGDSSGVTGAIRAD